MIKRITHEFDRFVKDEHKEALKDIFEYSVSEALEYAGGGILKKFTVLYYQITGSYRAKLIPDISEIREKCPYDLEMSAIKIDWIGEIVINIGNVEVLQESGEYEELCDWLKSLRMVFQYGYKAGKIILGGIELKEDPLVVDDIGWVSLGFSVAPSKR